MYIRNKIGQLIFLLSTFSSALSQPHYTINISNQSYRLNIGFVKTGTAVSVSGQTLSYNNLYLIKNGKPWFPIMGEMHYSRCNKKDWETSILKMRAAGIQIISSYIFWIHVEEKEGVFNREGNNDLRTFLSLCKKHGMYVWLRPGPWIHAEARNGGFPDWLMKKGLKLRTNDTGYLTYSARWFAEVAEQCKGFYFKDDGPVIGVQIENEMEFKKPAQYEHMKILKGLAIKAGMDVPYYSAFAQGPDNQDEFLYTMGGYPESPWATHTAKLYKPVYYIKPLEADTDIGSDLFGKVDGRVRNTYPKLGAELGSGMQKTYHRRVNVSSGDIGAMMMTRVACGINGMGYFMFHGGYNPIGSTSLQESRITGYPNDMPYIDYDFQAPVGAGGIIRESYCELRLLNSFLADFGEGLAEEKPYFPQSLVQSPFSRDTVQSSVRVKDNSGFIFLSNYQRHVNLPEVKDFQLHLVNGNLQEDIPSHPVRFKANNYTIWPYNLNINGAVLHYATAQPLYRLRTSSNQINDTYIFFADESAEFVFTSGTVKNYAALQNCLVEQNVVRVTTRNTSMAMFSILSKENQKTTIIVLSRRQALQAVKINRDHKDRLLITDGLVLNGEQLTVEKTSLSSKLSLEIYPAVDVVAASSLTQGERKKAVNKLFSKFILSSRIPIPTCVNIKQEKFLYDTAEADRFKDSVLQAHSRLASQYFNPKQPGPVYGLRFHHLPDEALSTISFTAPRNDLIKDYVVNFNYTGDIIALYKKDSLVWDQFNSDNNLSVRLSYIAAAPQTALTVQVLPFYKDYDIYVEDNMQAQRQREWLEAGLQHIILTPVYAYKIKLE